MGASLWILWMPWILWMCGCCACGYVDWMCGVEDAQLRVPWLVAIVRLSLTGLMAVPNLSCGALLIVITVAVVRALLIVVVAAAVVAAVADGQHPLAGRGDST